MTTIGFMGSGKIGGTLARLAAGAGHDVTLSNSRGPETLRAAAAELGGRAGTVEEAAGSDIVVVTIPIRFWRQVPVEPLRGTVVVDTMNYDPVRQPRVPEIENGDTPPHLLLQEHLPESFVVRAFTTMFFKHLATLGRPAGAPDRSAVPIAGDDDTAKAAVVALIDSLGFDAYDVGKLAESHRFAPGSPAHGAYVDPVGMFSAPGRPAPTAVLEKLLR
jgi:8-hydroxy-5-deazaflavin:NADPH oxidoreductase